jgi:hypothetical protein
MCHVACPELLGLYPYHPFDATAKYWQCTKYAHKVTTQPTFDMLRVPSTLSQYGVTVRDNVTSVYPPLEMSARDTILKFLKHSITFHTQSYVGLYQPVKHLQYPNNFRHGILCPTTETPLELKPNSLKISEYHHVFFLLKNFSWVTFTQFRGHFSFQIKKTALKL